MRTSFLAPVLLAILALLVACGGAGGAGGQATPRTAPTAGPTNAAPMTSPAATDDDYGDDSGY